MAAWIAICRFLSAPSVAEVSCRKTSCSSLANSRSLAMHSRILSILARMTWESTMTWSLQIPPLHILEMDLMNRLQVQEQVQIPDLKCDSGRARALVNQSAFRDHIVG